MRWILCKRGKKLYQILKGIEIIFCILGHDNRNVSFRHQTLCFPFQPGMLLVLLSLVAMLGGQLQKFCLPAIPRFLGFFILIDYSDSCKYQLWLPWGKEVMSDYSLRSNNSKRPCPCKQKSTFLFVCSQYDCKRHLLLVLSTGQNDLFPRIILLCFIVIYLHRTDRYLK